MFVPVALALFVSYGVIRTIHLIWGVEDGTRSLFGSPVSQRMRVAASVAAGVLGAFLFASVLLVE